MRYPGNARYAASWMQLDAGHVKSIAGVVTQGRRHHHQWVTSYKVKASADGKAWDEVEGAEAVAYAPQAEEDPNKPELG